MRILYSHRVQSHDGQSVHIEELIAAFRQLGHDVFIVGPGFYNKAEFGGESAAVNTMRRLLPNVLTEIAEFLYNIPALAKLRRGFRNFAPDFIYERYNLYYLGGALLKVLYNAPFYLEINSPLAEERAHFAGLRLRWLARRLERFVWKRADRIFVVTSVLGEIVAEAGVPRDRITVIPNAVQLRAFPFAPYRARRGEPIVIGFIGFAREWHGLNELISGLAAQVEPEMRLMIVGPRSPELESEAKAHGVAHIIQFTGLRERDEIPKVLRSFDLALQPRAVRYASPLKLFEYMASGRAIVAPDQPNIREILTHGENAILFNPNESGALWRAIRRGAVDPGLRERLGRAARQTLEVRNYTWVGNASKVIDAVSGDLVRGRVVENAAPRRDDRSVPRELR
jgi:glycosyltransferase involved in cell wall biosynthesis